MHRRKKPFPESIGRRTESRDRPFLTEGTRASGCVPGRFSCFLRPHWWVYSLLTSNCFEMASHEQLILSSTVQSWLCLGFFFITGYFLGTGAHCDGDAKQKTGRAMHCLIFSYSNFSLKT